MESFALLRHDLLNVVNDHDLRNTEQDLLEELMQNRTALLNIFDLPQPNADERKEIGSGKVTIKARQVAINQEFGIQVAFISQALNCSERLVASLLLDVVAENPNATAPRYVELALLEFHRRRRQLADCIRLLFDAISQEQSGGPATLHRIFAFVREHLNLMPVTPSTPSIVSTIIKQLELVSLGVTATDSARRNAQTNTVAPNAQGQGSLGIDVLTARYESLKYERRQLAIALYFIGRKGLIRGKDFRQAIDWLLLNPNHALTYYIFTAVMMQLDIVDPSTPEGQWRDGLAKDEQNLTHMAGKVGVPGEDGLKAALLMKWTLYLTDYRRRTPNLETVDGFKSQQLEEAIWRAVQGNAFNFLSVAVVHIERKQGTSRLPALLANVTAEGLEKRDIPTDEFKPAVLEGFASLIRNLLIMAPSELRKIKQRQEDIILANARRAGPSRFSTTQVSTPSSTTPRNDIAMLYSLIGILYTSLPEDYALQFWGAAPRHPMSYTEAVEIQAGKLPTFLQWSVWSVTPHDSTMMTALYDMLTGLAKGQQCSELTYNFMARGGVEVVPDSTLSSPSGGAALSWETIFGRLETWASSSVNARAPSMAPAGLGFMGGPSLQQSVQHPVLNPRDIIMAQSFLHLLATVVSNSVSVRVAISSHTQFRAIPTIVSLIPLSVPLELKGALFETLAAFCLPGAGNPGVEICKAVWTLLERHEVINVRPTSQPGYPNSLLNVKGVEVELEEIEAVHGLYPATIPFLELLATLIHTTKRVSLRDRISDPGTLSTIPETLGQPYRMPGIGPFVAFVVDNVFAKIPNREYLRPSDRWKMNELSLCFIERSLASFDVESLLVAAEAGPLKGETLLSLLVHPGYDIVKRLLTTSTLHQSITSYVVDGVDGFENGFADEEPHFATTIVRVLRIVKRVLEVQDVFLDVFIALLSTFDAAASVGPVHPRSYFTKFDQSLSFGPHFVPALASYVAYPAYSELVLLSVKIMSMLSLSPALSSMAVLIQRSDNSYRIMNGYISILQCESDDEALAAEALAEQCTGAGAPDVDPSLDLNQATRLAVLDLLIQSTETNWSHQSFARWLLFGSSKRNQQIEDPHALGGRQTCVHVVIGLLNVGVPRLKGKGKEREEHHGPPLFLALPALAERCYHIIHALCLDSSTSEFTMRYLRTQEDFIARHLAAIPTQGPRAESDPFIEVAYPDGSRIITTVSTFSSFLRSRSWIFNLVALELQVLMNKNQHKGVDELLSILFSTQAIYDQDPEWADDVFDTFREIGQSNIRIIEHLHSLAFDWNDSLIIEPMQLTFLADLPLHSCARKDISGCEVIDRNALLSLLTTARRGLLSQNRVTTAAHVEQIAKESQYILESCAVENHRREVVYAAAEGFEAWRRMLDTSFIRCFHRLPHDLRENVLFDLLHILGTILHTSEMEDSTSVLVAEVIVSCITKVREDRQEQVVLASVSGDPESNALPAERLYGIFKTILECIVDNSRLELVRGNLYAAVVNYVHLISPSTAASAPSLASSLSMSVSLAPSTYDNVFDDRQSTVPYQPSSAVQANSLALMKGGLERLVTTIARDAIDGTDVWKTVSFSLLTSLCQLSAAEKQHLVLAYLVRHGILTNFIHGVGESDAALQAILKPDPDDLNALYVYESKMALFVRIAHTRIGAERLLDANVLPILAQCDYIDSRPEGDEAFMEQDTFLPSAVQRYHQLLMPALELVNAIIATLGSKHTSATNQALDFLSRHSPTIVILLKNEMDDMSLSLLEEVHLIVSLCTNILSCVPKSELASTTSGFGAVHVSILSFSAQCLQTGNWVENIRPVTDAEIIDAGIAVPGFISESKFRTKVQQKERVLRRSLAAYLGSVSDFTEPELNVTLSPSTATPKLSERGSHFIAALPTLGDTIQALNDIVEDLGQMLNQMTFLSSELSARDQVSVENIQDIIQLESTALQDMDIAQKRTLVCQAYEHIAEESKKEAKVVIHTTEMLLLLLWRHTMYYCEGQQARPVEGKSYAIRLLSMPEPEAFKQEVGRALRPVLQRLRGLAMGSDWRENQAYIEIMDRRLRDTAGLHDNEDEMVS